MIHVCIRFRRSAEFWRTSVLPIFPCRRDATWRHSCTVHV